MSFCITVNPCTDYYIYYGNIVVIAMIVVNINASFTRDD